MILAATQDAGLSDAVGHTIKTERLSRSYALKPDAAFSPFCEKRLKFGV